MPSVVQSQGWTTAGFTEDSSMDLDVAVSAGNSLVILVNEELNNPITNLTFEGSATSIVWEGGTNNSKRIARIDGLAGGENTIRVVRSGFGRVGVVALEVSNLGANDYVSGTFDLSGEGDSTSHSFDFTAGGDSALAVALACDQPADARTYSGASGSSVRHAGTAPQNTAMLYQTGVSSGAGSISCALSTSGNRRGVAVTFLDAGAPSPTITSATPSVITPGTASITVTGTDFGATQGAQNIVLSATTDPAHSSARNQSITSWSDTEIVTNGVAFPVGAVDGDSVYVHFVE